MRVLWTLGHPKPRNVKLFRVHWGQTEAYFVRFIRWRILGFGAQNLYLNVYSCLKPIIFIHSVDGWIRSCMASVQTFVIDQSCLKVTLARLALPDSFWQKTRKS
jgi:hypothetical protein